MKCWAEWITSWNQDCWEKYQQPQICRWHHPYGRKWRGTKKHLDESKRGEWKCWLKTQHSKTKIKETSPIPWWQIDGKTMKIMADFIFLGSKIIPDSDCSHEIKRHLLLGRKAMTEWDSIMKSREITLLTKVHIVKAMVFPVVIYGWELDSKEGWVLKNWCFQTASSLPPFSSTPSFHKCLLGSYYEPA